LCSRFATDIKGMQIHSRDVIRGSGVYFPVA
jgi:hypothetical protein